MATKFHRVAEHLNLLPFNAQGLCSQEVGGKRITLVRTADDQLLACAHKCPHASGLMSDGWITPQNEIVCPLHRYKFSLEHGRNTTGEGYHLRIYPVEKRDDGWYVGLPSGLFG